MNIEEAKKRVLETRKARDDLRKQGGHRDDCRHVSGELNFDGDCNLCRVTKNYVQAMADKTAAEVFAKCNTQDGG